jgi:hypothetical protein
MNQFRTSRPVKLDQYARKPLRLNAPWIKTWAAFPEGDIPIIESRLSWRDYLGFVRMRSGIGRMKYTVPPGLYGLGSPGKDSPVFVTANYKMTFDILRRDLSGMDCWILVLDTRGINVWCAAGKGTFGTDELLNRIRITNISLRISHHEIILPQLGATGVAGHRVKKESGFRVLYGPVYSKNIPAFIMNGKKADPTMRKVHFKLRDRLVLVPLELIPALKFVPVFLVLFLAESLILNRPAPFFAVSSLGFLGAIVAGCVVVPLLLPWIPGRAFSFKGGVAGLIFSLIWSHITAQSLLGWIASCLIFTPAAAYLALNFTGSSTYTSMSGVNKEMRLSLPFIIPSLMTGLVLHWF